MRGIFRTEPAPSNVTTRSANIQLCLFLIYYFSLRDTALSCTGTSGNRSSVPSGSPPLFFCPAPLVQKNSRVVVSALLASFCLRLDHDNFGDTEFTAHSGVTGF